MVRIAIATDNEKSIGDEHFTHAKIHDIRT